MAEKHPYIQAIKRSAETPQTQPIKGRESEMVRGDSGGWQFKLDPFVRLDRFLKLGSTGGSYYVGADKGNDRFATLLDWCIAKDGKRVVDAIVKVSVEGSNLKQDPVLFAFARVCSYTYGDPAIDTVLDNPRSLIRQYAFAHFNKVIRTGSHLLMFMTFAKSMRGISGGIKRAVRGWYEARDFDSVLYQTLKYRQRDSWSQADVIRLAQPKAPDEGLYQFVKAWANKDKPWAKPILDFVPEKHDRIKAFTALQDTRDPLVAAALIRDYRLPWECVPTELRGMKEVEIALLQDMPVGAMVRQMGRLTAYGLTKNAGAKRLILDRLGNVEALGKARLHPIAVGMALKVYTGGRGLAGGSGRSGLTWQPDNKVSEALENAFYGLYDYVEPMGVDVTVAVDNSGSMRGGWSIRTSPLSPVEKAAMLAMVFVHGEDNVTPLKYDTTAKQWSVRKGTRLEDAIAKVGAAGGTNTTCVYSYMLKHKVDSNLVVVVSDGESWAGRSSMPEAHAAYIKHVGHSVKGVFIDTEPNTWGTHADPTRPDMLALHGFDATVPQAIRTFVSL